MNKKRKRGLLYSFFLSVLFFTNASFVYALEANYPSIFGLSINNSPSFPEYAKYFFNIGIMSAGILAVIVIAFGGVYYLIDLGRGRFKDEGKDWIKAGILGLLIIVCSYLIAYTINPYLVIFDLKGLAPLTFFSNPSGTPDSALPIDIYKEIPIGTLTETLLTRTMDCYEYDGNGDPIEGDKIKVDDGRTLNGPTYLDHDRADCFLKLAEAFEKKSNIANELAKKIAELMLQCNCAQSQASCWSKNAKDEIKIDKIAQNTCKTTLKEEDCEKGDGDEAVCIVIQKDCKFEGQANANCEQCPPEIVKKREHGPIELGLNDSSSSCMDKEYLGLDEFRSTFNNNYSSIKNAVEIKPPAKLKGKEISIIDKSSWHKLRLIDQLTYLKGKAEEIKEKVQPDIDNLKSAESSLEQCYLADASVDFLKKYEQTNKKDKVVTIQQTFSDPQSNEIINPAKYCLGFQFKISSCYSQCQKVCPGTTQQELDCYKGIPNCDDKNTEEGQACLLQQAEKIKECYNNRACLTDASPYKTFPECMTGCKQQCVDSCDQKACSAGDKEKCEEDCNKDSKCLLDNSGVCLVNFNRLKDCADQSGDNLDFFKNCVETSASLCKYCSDQYSGYPDCVTFSSYYNNGPKQYQYSSSFMYVNHRSQVCPYGITTTDINGNTVSKTTSACISQNLETSKCPTASKCPLCPCGTIEESTNPSDFDPNGKAWFTVYAHMKNIAVEVGQQVDVGDNIGQISNVGTDMGPHLHFAVGFENGNSGLDMATSFNISSKITLPGGNTTPVGQVTALPSYVTQSYKNYVLNSLTPPININNGNWIQQAGSALHNNTAAYAQDWVNNNGQTEGANVRVMSGGNGIKSTIAEIIPESGAVIIKHEVDKNILSSLLNSKISEYRVCSPTCDTYAFNDDPLTFYCNQAWWEKDEVKTTEPLGTTEVCPKEEEIPVGQSIDDAEKWGQNFINVMEDFVKETDDMIKYIKKIGEEKDYCKCNSTCGDGKIICQSKCIYVNAALDENGSEATPASCNVPPSCFGNPCQKMINLLLGKEDGNESTGNDPNACPNGTGAGFEGVEWHLEKIKNALKKVRDFILKDKRSDILKELSYSRKKVNTCSSNYLKETRILSCTRVEDEIIPPLIATSNPAQTIIGTNNPVASYCYGQALGKILKKDSLADNWFCCQTK